MAPSWHDWKIVDWDVKPQHNQQPTIEHEEVWRSVKKFDAKKLIIDKMTALWT